MAKKIHFSKKVTPRRVKKKQVKTERQNITLSPAFLKVISLVSICLFLYFIVYKHFGYKWAIDSLVIANMKNAYDNRASSVDDRYLSKLGFNYQYLKFVKDNTPENAVILWPSPENFLKNGEVKPFHNEHINDKRYASYFLQPRIIINKGDTSNYYYDQATHIAVVNKNGYELLNYPIASQQDYTVLPLRR